MIWYQLLDYGFTTLHTSVVLFVLFGWLRRTWRPVHLVLGGAILSSWFILGLRYGIGYCPSTEWHWRIKRQLGETELADSYVKHCLDLVLGRELDPGHVDLVVSVFGVSLFVVSLLLNWRDRCAKATS
ncbi:MAG TPA: DUF2784 family protein [Acidobacteriota bacterium]|nr:DUF2784 family protein [Acidobacteriota bacterium]